MLQGAFFRQKGLLDICHNLKDTGIQLSFEVSYKGTFINRGLMYFIKDEI